ncbi:MAG: hypothetical protein IPN86_00830 [Saprospiraceae bacterium]|nr:hypothetical protein [Saprospiraceae bacterium]
MKDNIEECDSIHLLNHIKINILAYRDSIKIFNEKANSELMTIKKAIEPNEKAKSEVSTLPLISGLDNYYKPNIQMLGSAKIEGFGVHNLGIFVGNSVSDTASIRTLILPENSRYGMNLKGNVNYSSKSNTGIFSFIGFNYSITYNDKETIGFDGNDKFAFKMVQIKGGGEAVVFKNFLSFYFNVNYDTSVSGNDSYKRLYKLEDNKQWYYDFGTKIFYGKDLDKYGGLGIFCDLNFIKLNDDLNKFRKESDILLPNIKLGLQKSLN